MIKNDNTEGKILTKNVLHKSNDVNFSSYAPVLTNSSIGILPSNRKTLTDPINLNSVSSLKTHEHLSSSKCNESLMNSYGSLPKDQIYLKTCSSKHEEVPIKNNFIKELFIRNSGYFPENSNDLERSCKRLLTSRGVRSARKINTNIRIFTGKITSWKKKQIAKVKQSESMKINDELFIIKKPLNPYDNFKPTKIKFVDFLMIDNYNKSFNTLNYYGLNKGKPIKESTKFRNMNYFI